MIYYVRHGETVWNREQRLQGRSDSPLTLRGVELAIGYARRLRDELADDRDIEIVCSPMGRARQTAAIIADLLATPSPPLRVDPLVAEHDVGDWSGLTWKEIGARHGVDRGQRADWDLRPPNGETRRELHARAGAWLARERSAAVTILVSHGGFSRMLRGAYLDAPLEEITRLSAHVHGRFFRLAGGACHEIATHPRPRGREELLG